jgi:hypothetical protein
MKNDLAVVLAAMLGKMPAVVVGKKFNSVNFTVRKKVFAFTKDGGVVLKLPPETVKALSKLEPHPCSSWGREAHDEGMGGDSLPRRG